MTNNRRHTDDSEVASKYDIDSLEVWNVPQLQILVIGEKKIIIIKNIKATKSRSNNIW